MKNDFELLEKKEKLCPNFINLTMKRNPVYLLMLAFLALSCEPDTLSEYLTLGNEGDDTEIIDNPESGNQGSNNPDNPDDQNQGGSDQGSDQSNTGGSEPSGGPQGIPENAVRASTFGYNSTDATDALINAIQSDNEVILIDRQNSDWNVRPIRITNLRNKHIIFEEGVILKALPGSFSSTSDQLFELRYAENVTIEGYGATFQMNKSEYNSGEWRHALALWSSTNVVVRGLTLRDSGGDGIYLAGSQRGEFCKDILIEDIESINNRRQGMSIISAENVWVKNSIFRDTKGTLPEAGVDLEPNNESDRIVNINFEGCKFLDNNHAGILLALHFMTENSIPVSIFFKDCELSGNSSLENDYIESEIVLDAKQTSPVGGLATFENVVVDGSDFGMVYSRKPANAYTAVFKDCIGRNLSQRDTHPPILLEAIVNGPTLGGFVFDNLLLEYDTNEPFFQVRGNSDLRNLKDIDADITIREPFDNPPRYIGYDPDNNINVNLVFRHVD